MSRPRNLRIIHAEEAYRAINYFETAEPRSEEEFECFVTAVVALYRALIDEEQREKRNEYNRNRRKESPEVAEHYKVYQREYRAKYRQAGRDKWMNDRKGGKKADGE